MLLRKLTFYILTSKRNATSKILRGKKMTADLHVYQPTCLVNKIDKLEP